MFLSRSGIININSIAHEGKVILFGTDEKGRVHYTVRQDGFEDSYLNTPEEKRDGWEEWNEVIFPDEDDDLSVVEKEKEEWTLKNKPHQFLMRSRYKTAGDSIVAPVQLLSALGHIYIFRQSKRGTLLVDRFVFDGMTNKLGRKLQVRFKRSRQRHKPTDSMKKGTAGMQNVDSLDYCDPNGAFFYEPTLELCLVDNLHEGWYSVVLVPTEEHEKNRFHIFFYNKKSQKIEITSVRTSEEGLFEMKDSILMEKLSDADTGLTPRQIPGLIRRVLHIEGSKITGGPAATLYNLQQERETKAGPQLLKTATKVMLTVPTDQGLASVSFDLATDGTLSPVDEKPDQTILRADDREMLLPLNTLEEIKGFGIKEPPPQGSIVEIAMGTEDEGITDKVRITSEEAALLEDGDRVEIMQTEHHNGLYQALPLDDHTFSIERGGNGSLGVWEKVEKAQSLTFEGMITSYEVDDNGRVTVTAPDHGLKAGDSVQIAGTQAYNNSYAIKKIDDGAFSIGIPWGQGEAVNLRLQAMKRRGIVFDGKEAALLLPPGTTSFQKGITVECWLRLNGAEKTMPVIDWSKADGSDQIRFFYNGKDKSLLLSVSGEKKIEKLTAKAEIPENVWTHLAFTINKEGKGFIYRDGEELATGSLPLPKTGEREESYVGRDQAGKQFLAGELSDLRLWCISRTKNEIKNTMWPQLTGRETGLEGHWKLGGIVEGKVRKVIDFSPNKMEGIVLGGAYVGNVTLPRKLRDGNRVIRFTNNDLFAVSQRSTYLEEFEFRIRGEKKVNVNKADKTGKKVFNITCWGKESRNSETLIPFNVVQEDFEELEGGWYRAEGRFTVPDGVGLVRNFEISNVRGEWQSLEVRKHRVRLISDSITQALFKDPLPLKGALPEKVDFKGAQSILTRSERREEELSAEKSFLTEEIARLRLLEQASEEEKKRKIDCKSEEIKEQEKRVTLLKKQVTPLQKIYDAMKKDPRNFICRLSVNVGSCWKDLHVHRQKDKKGNPIVLHSGKGNLWRFIPSKVKGEFTAQIKVGNNWRPLWGMGQFVPFGGKTWNNLPLAIGSGDGTLFRFVGEKGGDRIQIKMNKKDWVDLHVYHQKKNDNTAIVTYKGAGNFFKVVATEMPFSPFLAPHLDTLNRLKDELKKTEAILTKLKEELALLEGNHDYGKERTEKETLLVKVEETLKQVRTDLVKANDDCIKAAFQQNSKAQTLALLHKAGADAYKELETRGALLRYLHPASRLSSLADCEGNVRLSYMDDEGRMRQSCYDAAADSKNAFFQQWVPDTSPACLNLEEGQSKVTPKESLTLGLNWTLETWFENRPHASAPWRVLTASADGEEEIGIFYGKSLAIKINGLYRDCGVNLETFSRGWHHLAVVGREDGIYSFYLNGKNVGQTKRMSVIELNGKKEALTVKDSSSLRLSSYTLELWLRPNTLPSGNGWAGIAGKPGRNFNIWLHGKGYIHHRFHTTKQTNNGIADTKRDLIKAGQWSHVAIVNDGSLAKTYVNGELASQGVVKEALVIDKTSLIIGRNPDGKNTQYFNGKLGEVRLWRGTRSHDELTFSMGKALSGKEPSLVGYWNFADGSPLDRTSYANDATIEGECKPHVHSFKVTEEIALIGNSVKGNNPFGKMAELRFWGAALNEEEVEVNSKTRLNASEPDLLACYPMNEGNGTQARDHSANSNHASLSRTKWWGFGAALGNPGHEVTYFDGEGDYIDLGSKINLSEKSFTIEFWARKEKRGPNQMVLFQGKKGEKDKALHIGYRNNGKFTFAFWSNDVNVNDPTGLEEWHHWCCVYDAKAAKRRIYLDGKKINDSGNTRPYKGTGKLTLAGGLWSGSPMFKGRMAELRIWNVVRSDGEVAAHWNQRLTGKEKGLLACLSLQVIKNDGKTETTPDETGRNKALVHNAIVKADNALPMKADSLVAAEYSTVSVDELTGQKKAVMRRFFASPTAGGVHLFPEKRIENLKLIWVGNAQFAPTLLGYIEGAPPIPSENCTVKIDYNGATAVELNMSDDVEFSWRRNQESGLGASVDLFAGVDSQSDAGGMFFSSKAVEVRAGLKGSYDRKETATSETNITSSSSQMMTDRLELRGAQEEEAKFPHLGQRYVPKNIGYALVISSLADVFITKLERSGRMVGYQVNPVEGVPPDVNTITFLMNPAYVSQGSLDGLTGSSASDNRFHKHVPAMRAQYGSLYPASYYRLTEAYDIKQKIENDDRRRESYFAQFDSSKTDASSMEDEVDSGEDPQALTFTRAEDQEEEEGVEKSEEEQKAEEKAKLSAMKREGKSSRKKKAKEVEKKQKEIDARISDGGKRAHAAHAFEGWQKKMENIQIKAGKRNIVNTYVWDADGGLRKETQNFAGTVEHSIGGMMTLDATLGGEAHIGVFGAKVELTALSTLNMTQTMNKTERRSKGVDLVVDLSGVESLRVTDHNDYPLQPGEKVDRYRFMSYYLEGSTNNFNDFFNYVVDPEWLQSNDEEARALRQVVGKPNKTWRVLHRVTYVERPALMGFGRDLRAEGDGDGVEAAVNYFQLISNKTISLDSKVNQILAKLEGMNSGTNSGEE